MPLDLRDELVVHGCGNGSRHDPGERDLGLLTSSLATASKGEIGGC
jgi:hypothetical protein